jgi:hypothetical protein
MLPVWFEPTIPVFEPAKTVHALDCAATVIGRLVYRPDIENSLSVGPNEVFSGYQPCQFFRNYWRFRDLILHCILMTVIKMFPETSVVYNQLTRPIAREVYNKFSCWAASDLYNPIILSQFYGVLLYTDFGVMTWFIGLFDTAHDYTLQYTVTHTRTLVPTVTSSLPLLSSGFQLRTFPFLWIPELSPASATSF